MNGSPAKRSLWLSLSSSKRSLFAARPAPGVLCLVLFGLALVLSCRQGNLERSHRSSNAPDEQDKSDKKITKKKTAKKKDDSFKQGQASVPISGVNLVGYDNARARCDYKDLGAREYEVFCHAATVRPDGSETKGEALAEGVSLAWQDPQVLEGSTDDTVCQTNASTLGFHCDVKVSTLAELTKLNIEMKVRKEERDRSEAAIVTLPYSVGVSAGFVPSTPFFYQQVSSSKTEASSDSKDDDSKAKSVGFQKFQFPATAYQFMGPSSMCFSRTGDGLYFTAGMYVYKVTDGSATLFAGSGRDTLKNDFTHRMRTANFNATRIACAKEGVYISDAKLNRILLAKEDGSIKVVAGTGMATSAEDGAVAAKSPINTPFGLAMSPDGDLYFTERSAHKVRKITAEGRLATVAGTGSAGYTGDEGAATNAQLDRPQDLRFDDDGALYLSDYGNHVVRKISTSGAISTVAGTGTARYNTADDPEALAEPMGLDIDGSGNVYVAEYYRGIKKISSTGNISTVVPGTDIGENALALAQSQNPADKAKLKGLNINQFLTLGPGGHLYIDSGDGIVARSLSGEETTIVGAAASAGDCDGSSPAVRTRLIEASTMDYLPDGSLAIADWKNFTSNRFRIKKIFKNDEGSLRKTDIHGCGSSPLFTSVNNLAEGSLVVNSIGGITAHDGAFYVTNYKQNILFEIDPDGTKTVLAGDGTLASNGDGGAASDAQIGWPIGVDVGPNDNIYLVEYMTGKVRKIDATTGTISTVAGTGVPGDSGDGGLAVNAQIAANNLAVAPDGSIYLSDYGNYKIKRIDGDTGIIETIAGTGASGNTKEASDATNAPLGLPVNLDVTNDGTVIFVDLGNQRVQELEQNDAGSWELSTLFGKDDTRRDCGIGTLQGNATAHDVDNAVKNSLSVICPGVPRAVTVKDSCPSDGGETRIAITQAFHEYSNVVEIVRPCASN